MLHQLHMMSVQDPRVSLLRELASTSTPLPSVLSRLAAFHAASQKTQLPLRENIAYQQDRFYPHPQDVPALLLFSFKKLGSFWPYCASEEDDLFVIAYVLYALFSIHPFEHANGRTAMDFAQYLLMKRWELKDPPLRLPRDIHHHVAGYFSAMDEPCVTQTPEAFYAMRLRLAHQLDQLNVSRLRENPTFQLVTSFFQQSLQSL